MRNCTGEQGERARKAKMAADRHEFAARMLRECVRSLGLGIEPKQLLREALAASDAAHEYEQQVGKPSRVRSMVPQ